MRTHFVATHPLFGRVNNRLPISYQQRSPYYWWWAFLRRNEEYLACCANGGEGRLKGLYADFGDVSNDNFHAWWKGERRGSVLFAEKPLPLNLKELKDSSEWNTDWTGDAVMVVAVPLSLSKRHLQSKFAQLLKVRHGGKRGRKTGSEGYVSTAKYRLHRAVSVETLRIQLAVYDAVIAKRQGLSDKKLWEIGQEMRLVRSAMPAKGDHPHDTENKRKAMASAVSRHFKAAERIIANVVKGEFPNSA